MEGQAGNDYGQDQQGGSQKSVATSDQVLDGFNRALDAMMQEYTFNLSDVLGAVNVLKIQVEEQILFQYRANLHAANAKRLAETESIQE